MKEYWDVYDKNRIFQNRTIRRGDPFNEGEYYVCCEAWIVNSKRELLATKRHPSKKAGGLWEFIGGGVLSGETAKRAAMREIKEEIGIDVAETDLRFLYEYKNKNYFMDIYVVYKDIDIRNIVLNQTETIDVKWVTNQELQQMIDNQQFVRSVALRYDLLKDRLMPH